MALHRPHPVGSARKSAAAIVTPSSSACKIAVTLAKSIYLRAVKIAIVVPISAPTRNHIRRLSCLAKFQGVTLVTQNIRKTGGTVIILGKNTAWNKAISENRNSIKASLVYLWAADLSKKQYSYYGLTDE